MTKSRILYFPRSINSDGRLRGPPQYKTTPTSSARGAGNRKRPGGHQRKGGWQNDLASQDSTQTDSPKRDKKRRENFAKNRNFRRNRQTPLTTMTIGSTIENYVRGTLVQALYINIIITYTYIFNRI